MTTTKRIAHPVAKEVDTCPYCKGTAVVKTGVRENKYGAIQLFFCNRCKKKFTPLITKNKTYPLRVILDAVSLYNELRTPEESADSVSKRYGLSVSASNVRRWIEDFRDHLPFLRMREFVEKKFERKDIIERNRMFHGQIYDFLYHRAKMQLLLEDDFRHAKLKPLQQFLDLVSAECPHRIFRESAIRASDFKNIFTMDQVHITPKVNRAVESARVVLQTVTQNKLRHPAVQNFMLVNDSVTVAAEVPVLLDADDVRHFKDRLGFDVPLDLADGETLTGHIDLLQVRNGAVHILDYKPRAEREQPIAQLTLYALALSRLTTLRLFQFKCAWFDENNYYEFFPLHVVYKKGRKPTRKRSAITKPALSPQTAQPSPTTWTSTSATPSP